MASSARRPKRRKKNVLAGAGSSIAAAIAARPALAGGSTAFLIAMTYVSANALWYQPHAHQGALFATRDMPWVGGRTDEPSTTFIIERDAATARPKPDPDTRFVQSALKELGFYHGAVDGLTGPNTRRAIQEFQTREGLPPTGAVDSGLLARLRDEPRAEAPERPPMTVAEAISENDLPAVSDAADPTVVKLQAGLRAFGNEGLEIDGVIGSRTRQALTEFQSLFGLPPTGDPDEVTLAKMREIGLTN